jgi:hypothetical protein
MNPLVAAAEQKNWVFICSVITLTLKTRIGGPTRSSATIVRKRATFAVKVGSSTLSSNQRRKRRVEAIVSAETENY